MGGNKYKFVAYSGVIVFILSIVYFGVSIYATMIRGEEQSQNEFSAFVQQADINSYMSLKDAEDFELYYQNVKNAVDQNSYIGAVIFSENNTPIFAYPLSSNVIQFDTNNMPMLLSSSPMLKTHSMSILSQSGSSSVLNAVSYILRPEDIYNSARVSFLIILAYTLFLVVIIVYASLSNSQSTAVMRIGPKNDSYKKYNETVENQRETIPVVFKETESSWDNFFVGTEKESSEESEVKDTVDEIHDEIRESEHEQAIDDDDAGYDLNFVEEYVHEETANNSNLVSEKEEVSETVNIQNVTVTKDDASVEEEDAIAASPSNDPKGLFSDSTGIGWESYLETRLDSELRRAASSEQDLALVFIQVKGVESNIAIKKKIATLLLNYFKYRDLVFEYKADGFAGIMLDVNLDQSMLLTEELYRLLSELLSNEELTDTSIGIGLSTRALRMLPGSRIITEASQAVARSFMEEDVPIVAFRVSPEKYSQYVSNSTL